MATCLMSLGLPLTMYVCPLVPFWVGSWPLEPCLMILVTPAARGLATPGPCLLPCLLCSASNLLPVLDLSLPVLPIELFRSELTLEWDILQVLVDWVEFEAAESFLLLDRVES